MRFLLFTLVITLGLNQTYATQDLHRSRSARDKGHASSTERTDSDSNMVRIPSGSFWMGRTRLWFIEEIGWQALVRMDDRPVHEVRLGSYWIDETEVTQESFLRFVEDTGHRPPFHWKNGNLPRNKEDLPVYNVSWHDAQAFCAWANKRLPTEAEWERAARGKREGASYPWGNRFMLDWDIDGEDDPMAHFGFPEGPTSVSRFLPNDFGLYDTIGNVWEWVSDGYAQHYYSVSPVENPTGPKAGARGDDTGAEAPVYRIYRGGSWADRDERMLSVYYRNFTDPLTRANTIGFRCARSEN